MINDLRTAAVIDAFKKRTNAIHPELRNRVIKTVDYDSASYLIESEQLVCVIIESNNKLFKIGQDESGRQYIDCKNPDLLKVINRCITSGYGGSIVDSFPIHKFHPYVNLFIKVNNELGSVLGTGLTHYDKVAITVDILNDFIDRIRREEESPKFKKSVANYQSNVIKNYKGLMNYTNYLFDNYSRLLVFRIDFGYIKDQLSLDKNKIEKMYRQARKDRKDFIKREPIENDNAISIFEHRVGYVWKLEYSNIKGFYYRMFFFFDGSKVQLDGNSVIKIPEDIGEYWKTIITQGKGLYLIRNSLGNMSIRNGFGIINCDGHNRRDMLEKLIGNLIKPDYYAKIDTPGKEKAFGKGEILKQKLIRL
jgi:Inovirus Gp2